MRLKTREHECMCMCMCMCMSMSQGMEGGWGSMREWKGARCVCEIPEERRVSACKEVACGVQGAPQTTGLVRRS